MEFAIGTPALILTEGLGSAWHCAFSVAGIVAVLSALAFDSRCHALLVKAREEATPGGVRDEIMVEEALIPADDSPQVAHDSGLGLRFAAAAGMAYSLWPCFAEVAEGKCQLQAAGMPLPVESFYLIQISTALAAIAIVVPFTSHWALTGRPSILFWQAYWSLPSTTHFASICGGVMQGLGTTLSLSAGQTLGVSVSMSITRCSPVVAAFWGVAVWNELRDASSDALAAFAGMVVMYLLAVAFLSLAALG
eukprot:TRINITY_DN111268_c0_g1_i1.p1 TRINITY_DN111268_c0_g1~~TRINITY_DN111268_c0_g1_i1.p1  ORF type:complete len:265 (+),score=36.27 TRINITY_DN111268_c0_g1_i1:48-797(+)